jgi:hypothetical protein
MLMPMNLPLSCSSALLLLVSCAAPPLLQDGTLEGDAANQVYQDWQATFSTELDFPVEYHVKSTWTTIGFFPGNPDVEMIMGSDMDFVLHDAERFDSSAELRIDAMGIKIKFGGDLSNDKHGLHVYLRDPAFLRMALEQEIPSFMHLSANRVARIFEELQASIDVGLQDSFSDVVAGVPEWLVRTKRITGMGAALHPKNFAHLVGSFPLVKVTHLQVADGIAQVTYGASHQMAEMLETEAMDPVAREIFDSLQVKASFHVATGALQNYYLEAKVIGPTPGKLEAMNILVEFSELQAPIVPAPTPDPNEVMDLNPFFDSLTQMMDGSQPREIEQF